MRTLSVTKVEKEFVPFKISALDHLARVLSFFGGTSS
jgi:hypothetical protein